jgi:hypothetical protein
MKNFTDLIDRTLLSTFSFNLSPMICTLSDVQLDSYRL